MIDGEQRWLKVVALALALSCFASFTWAIFTLFKRRNEAALTLMHAVSVFGSFFFVAQVVALLLAQADADRMVFMVGLLLYMASLALFWWAVPFARNAAFGTAFAGVIPAHVVREGPYRFIRHPFYASYLLFWIAGVLVSQNWWLLLSAVVMGALYATAIRQEEHELLGGSFSSQYKEYMERTGCLLPRLSRPHPISRR